MKTEIIENKGCWNGRSNTFAAILSAFMAKRHERRKWTAWLYFSLHFSTNRFSSSVFPHFRISVQMISTLGRFWLWVRSDRKGKKKRRDYDMLITFWSIPMRCTSACNFLDVLLTSRAFIVFVASGRICRRRRSLHFLIFVPKGKEIRKTRQTSSTSLSTSWHEHWTCLKTEKDAKIAFNHYYFCSFVWMNVHRQTVPFAPASLQHKVFNFILLGWLSISAAADANYC